MKLRENVKDHSRQWQARVDLFADIEKALLRDPAGEIAQALVARWRAQLDDASGGDPEIKTALLQGLDQSPALAAFRAVASGSSPHDELRTVRTRGGFFG